MKIKAINLPMLSVLVFFVLLICFSSNLFAAYRYIDNGDGTVYDSQQELMWQKKDDGVKRTFAEALQPIKEMSYQSKVL